LSSVDFNLESIFYPPSAVVSFINDILSTYPSTETFALPTLSPCLEIAQLGSQCRTHRARLRLFILQLFAQDESLRLQTCTPFAAGRGNGYEVA